RAHRPAARRRRCGLLCRRGVRSEWRRYHGVGELVMASPLDWSLAEISARLADGRLRARALIEAAQARHDPSLNAYKTWSPELALRQADAADAAFAADNRLGAL